MNFISIDFETGMYKRESAVSVGLVKYQDGIAKDTFYSLIRPPKLYIRPDFTAIHGLTVDDVENAPFFPDIWESINSFISGFPLAAHNAAFDMGVLRAVLEYYSLPIPPVKYFCTLALARNMWPELESHALAFLAKNFEINYKAHNALDDARTCGKLVQMAAEQLGSSSLKELFKTAGIRMKKL